MPELPEVNRVVNILRRVAVGRTIENVTSSEDSIVFCDGITNTDFENEIKGRKIVDVGRRGKLFYIMFDGGNRHAVLHLGMTGNVYVKGTDPRWYQSSPKALDESWPPKYFKFILTLSPDASSTAGPSSSIPPAAPEIVFVDARRLGRIRLVSSPLTEPPISNLGFDPILSMPPLSTFLDSIRTRNCTIKSLLLDQSFSAGVGNWVADEVLFHARVHPEQKPSLMGDEKLGRVWESIKMVCETAVEVNADASQFPEGWLFKHRWGKGKKKDSEPSLILPNGERATIKWITVGSRTSAFVPSVQKLYKTPSKNTDGDSSDLSEAESSEPPTATQLKKRTPPIHVVDSKPKKGPEPKGKRKRGQEVTAEAEGELVGGGEGDPLSPKGKRKRSLKGDSGKGRAAGNAQASNVPKTLGTSTAGTSSVARDQAYSKPSRATRSSSRKQGAHPGFDSTASGL